MLQKLAARKTVKDYTKLLDELTALAVKARDQFHCRASGCAKQWLPVMLASGRVLVAEDCHWAHIVPRARGLALRHEMNNGITLCFRHHKQFDALDESQRLEFLESCGVATEVFMDLQARAHEVVVDFDGEEKAWANLMKLEEGLLRCEREGITMELVREQVTGFFRARIE